MRRLSLSLGLLAPLALGCNIDKPADPIPADEAPQRLAEQICAQLFECDCNNAGDYASEAECVTQKALDIGNAMDEVAAMGGSWSPQCAGELAQAWSEWGCLGDVAAQAEATFIIRACELTHGELPLGSSCYHGSFGDECSPGLACVDGSCREAPTFPVPEGGVCEYDYENLPCEEGTYCAWAPADTLRYCSEPPEAGQSCAESNAQCGPTSLGLYCNYDTQRCAEMPQIGESCAMTFQCRPDAYCDGGKDMTCQPRQEIGLGCSNNAVCVPDAICQDNICTAGEAAVCGLRFWP